MPQPSAAELPREIAAGGAHAAERRAVVASRTAAPPALGAHELAQRAPDAVRPRGSPRAEVRAGGHHPSATLAARPRSTR